MGNSCDCCGPLPVRSGVEHGSPSPVRRLLWLAVVVASGLYVCGPIIDPDLWWHITVGKWILAHQDVPRVDYWNMFSAGKPWRAYSWSSEAVLAMLDGVWGIKGLLAAKMLLAILISASLFYCLGRISRDWFFGGLLGMYATASCFNHFTLRPQSLIWVLLIWLIYTVDLIGCRGLSGRRACALFMIMMLWANTHLTTALGIFVALGWLWQRGRIALAVKVGAICFLGTLITPYLGGEWLTFFAKSGHPFRHSAIAEFKPATILQYSTAFLAVLAVFCGVFLHHRPRALPFARLLTALAMILAGLAVVKFLPWAVIYLCACVGSIWEDAGDDRSVLGELAEGIERLRRIFEWLPEAGLTFVFLCAAFLSYSRTWAAPLDLEHVPVAAVDFIQQHKLPRPILNEFGKGGYLMYRFSDAAGNLEERVPIDGRTNVNDPVIWRKFFDALQGRNNWREYIDAVNPGTIIWNTHSALSSLLLEDAGWCEVFRSKATEVGYAVYVKREYWERHYPELKSVDCSPTAAMENAG